MSRTSPSHRSPPELNASLERNIRALIERRRRLAAKASLQDRMAGHISDFAGSMAFVYIHIALFGGWIAINVGLIPFIPAWDPSLVVLAMVASVEAIFLSTFVLINQNRMAAADAERAELDLQINLLNEHETTKLIALVDAIARHLGLDTVADEEVEELKRDVSPETVLDRLAQTDAKR